MLSHMSLANHYQICFAMAQHYHYSLTELDELLPYELDLYMQMIVDHIQARKDQGNGH